MSINKVYRLFFPIYEGMVSAIYEMERNFLRTFLTTLGVLIGVFSIVTTISFLTFVEELIDKQLNSLVVDNVTLQAYTTPEERLMGITKSLRYRDYNSLRNYLDQEVIMSPINSIPYIGKVSTEKKTINSNLITTNESYAQLNGLKVKFGRFLNSQDYSKRKNVVFIGESLFEKLGLTPSDIGVLININSNWFQVIGVSASKGKLFGLDQDNFAIVPMTTLHKLEGDKVFKSIKIIFGERIREKNYRSDVTARMDTYYEVTNTKNRFYEFIDSNTFLDNLSDIKRIVSLSALGIVLISLIVGGVGVMNIMLVSINERKCEIGIKKALGATPVFIFTEFMIEAVVLTSVGAYLGILMSILLIEILNFSLDIVISVELYSIFIALVFTFLVGLFAGVGPSLKASSVEPVKAIDSW